MYVKDSLMRLKVLVMAGITAMVLLTAWVFSTALVPSTSHGHVRIAELIRNIKAAAKLYHNELPHQQNEDDLQCQIVSTLSR